MMKETSDPASKKQNQQESDLSEEASGGNADTTWVCALCDYKAEDDEAKMMKCELCMLTIFLLLPELKHDKDHIDELLKFLEIDASISNIQRLDRRLNPSEESQESGNTEVVNAANINTKRPLKITFTSEEDAAKIFANLYKLRDAEDTMKSIRVSHDLNKEQREEMRELVQKAKNLTESEERN
ncbi:hypothetical protein CAPTEDRAFT_186808 [Capitella teleta]|uniref:Uncharacterized protein n=1 Tax=Capitella teleta TaxID=283909 RepID=R7T357_CAPTE|nr:hypothetical protein CAPTEDRAFT_186808 [Capitella teleta]|eukprot:ELT87023.1 hypothetical protein CAPTEDRAFT_186808 [Capitella teleta]